jgi:hypothetical protein
VQVLHRDCGGQVHAEMVCEACHADVEWRDVRTEPGPGLTDPTLLARVIPG